MRINCLRISILFLIISISLTSVFCQSKFEYGIGIAINHSKINENIATQTGPIEGSFKVLRLPALTTRIGYKHSDRFHMNSGIGFSWLGALRKNLKERIIASTLEVPLQLEWNPKPYFHISSGLVYNYVYGLSSETEHTKSSILQVIDTPHQMGFRHGISISHRLIEFSLSYSHYFTDLFNLALTDENGNVIGSSKSKLKNIQLGIIFRG